MLSVCVSVLLLVWVWPYTHCLWRPNSYHPKVGSLHMTRKIRQLSEKNQLLQSLGPKRVLQELIQFLFNGQNPVYVWIDSELSLEITVSSCSIKYRHSVRSNVTTEDSVTNNFRKRQEEIAARKMFNYLKRSHDYKIVVNSWLSKRLNRGNRPKVIQRTELVDSFASYPYIVLIDTENVPDFRSNFYINGEGVVKFLSPESPKPLTAPSLQDYANDGIADTSPHPLSVPARTEYTPAVLFPSEKHKERRRYMSNGKMVDQNDWSSYRNRRLDDALLGTDSGAEWSDQDILILAYAHDRGAQATWANRVTSDTRKDAADVMIMLDIGALQMISTVRSILLITHDKFGQSVRHYFLSNSADIRNLYGQERGDKKSYKDRGNKTIDDVTKSSVISSPQFQLVTTCRAATVTVGRIPLPPSSL